MRTLILSLILVCCCASAQTLEGAELQGSASLSGILQKLVIKDKLPVGSISSSYGYGVLDFKNSSSYLSSKNKALYCVGGATMAASSKVKLIGFGFGGDASVVTTFDNCKKPEDYTGGFLKFGITYGGGKGSKSVDFEGAINLGFDFKHFNDQLERRFLVNFRGEHEPYKKRLSGVFKHLSNFIAKKQAANVQDISLSFLKLFSYIASPSTNFSNLAVFDNTDRENLQNKNLTIKQQLSNLNYDIRRDMDMYECPDLDNYNACIERAADVLIYLEILESSLADCHAFSITVSPQTEFSLSLFSKNKFGVNIGYFHYHLEKTYQSTSSNVTQVNKYYWGHNFNYRSDACGDVANKGADEIGRFLGILKI